MAAKRRGLGRGLDALLGPVVEGAEAPGSMEEISKIPVDLLRRGRFQPRLDLRKDSLQELADSIRAQGVVQPIIIRALPDPTEDARYEIIAGERRWRAAQMAGLDEIPAVIRDVSDETAIAMALIENIQREDLNPLEEARALTRLISQFDVTHQEAADAIGRSRAAVSNILRLLDLNAEVQSLLEHREVDMGHARALLALPEGKQPEVAHRVVRKGLSVRETERLVKRLLAEKPAGSARAKRVDPNIRALQQDLSEKLGARVTIQQTASGKGRLQILYNSLDELDGILNRIK